MMMIMIISNIYVIHVHHQNNIQFMLIKSKTMKNMKMMMMAKKKTTINRREMM